MVISIDGVKANARGMFVNFSDVLRKALVCTMGKIQNLLIRFLNH